MKYTTTVIALMLIGSISLLAQDGKPSEMDEIYVPDENSIFGGGGDKSGGNYSETMNTIKFNPTLITRSIIGAFYERYLVDDLSIQVGIGTCFAEDRIFGVGSELGSLSEFTENEVTLGMIINDGEFYAPSSNMFYSVATRFFWGSYYSDDNYFEVSYRFYSNAMKVEAEATDYSPYIVGTPVVDIRNSTFYMTYGFQVLTDGTITTAHDFYFGFGLRSTSFDSFDTESREFVDSWGTPYTQDVYVKSSSGRDRKLGFSVIVGYAFGFGF